MRLATLLLLPACTTYLAPEAPNASSDRDPPGFDPSCALGTHCNPHRIDGLPYAAGGDTRASDERFADRYSCASSDESGAETWYVVDLASPGLLTAAIDEVSGDGIDVDVHILLDADPDTCLARGNASAQAQVDDGFVFVVVDTWTSSGGTEYPGPYELSVGFTPSAGAPQAPSDGTCPSDMVAIADYCIDRYEAYIVGQDPYEAPVPGGAAANAFGAVPQAYLSGEDAALACSMAGKRLCTSTEWIRACEGASGNTYPYGDTYVDGACNEGRSSHPIVDLFGAGATWTHDQLNDPRLNQLPDSLAPSGAFGACESDDGVFDLHGNLHEWVDDPSGTFRGGFYVDASINGAGCSYRTTRHTFDYADYSTGFRCCADR